MATLTEIQEEKMRGWAKDLARDFLSRGMTMRDLTRYSEIVKEEAEYQVENNTIGGLSNGVIV